MASLPCFSSATCLVRGLGLHEEVGVCAVADVRGRVIFIQFQRRYIKPGVLRKILGEVVEDSGNILLKASGSGRFWLDMDPRNSPTFFEGQIQVWFDFSRFIINEGAFHGNKEIAPLADLLRFGASHLLVFKPELRIILAEKLEAADLFNLVAGFGSSVGQFGINLFTGRRVRGFFGCETFCREVG